MKSRKTLALPRVNDLRSNKVEDIRTFLFKVIDELDKQWRLLHADVSTIQVDADGFIYFGNKDTDGSWRVGVINEDYTFQRKVAGTWTDADAISGT